MSENIIPNINFIAVLRKDTMSRYFKKLEEFIRKLMHKLMFEKNLFALLFINIENFIKQQKYKIFNVNKKLAYFIMLLIHKLKFDRAFQLWLKSIKLYNAYILKNVKKIIQYYSKLKYKLQGQIKAKLKEKSFPRRMFDKACWFKDKMKASIKKAYSSIKEFFLSKFFHKKQNFTIKEAINKPSSKQANKPGYITPFDAQQNNETRESSTLRQGPLKKQTVEQQRAEETLQTENSTRARPKPSL